MDARKRPLREMKLKQMQPVKAPPRIQAISGAWIGLTLFTGCGQAITGTFSGTESVTFTNAVAALTPNQITISLTEVNNDTMLGSLQSIYGSGTITGRPSGELSLVNFTLIQAYPNTITGITSSATVNCGTYVGKLVLSSTQISGTLTLTQPAALPATGPATQVQSISQICPQTRVISATKNS